tara:strand:+ start:2085 stop:2750 length:666 start_codon:yes stop_codon:yes gene_type:complete
MKGEIITYGEQENQGYLCLPKNKKGPGLIILQEWWGLVGHIKLVADRYAENGFVVLAPDLYNGEKATEPNEAQKLMMELKIDEAGDNIKSAVKYLRNLENLSTNKVGCIGYCMGGGLSLYMATTGYIDAAVPYYGVLVNVNPDWSTLNCPILGHYAEHDGATEALPEIKKEIEKYRNDSKFYIYENTEHAFFNDERKEVYNKDAAEKSFERTIKFLNKSFN